LEGKIRKLESLFSGSIKERTGKKSAGMGGVCQKDLEQDNFFQ
jgi:hypothetical protein